MTMHSLDERSPQERTLGLARAATNPETRPVIVRRLIEDSIPFEGLPAVDIFKAAYGDPDGRDYWLSWTSQRISAYDFAQLLATHWVKQTGRAPVPVINGVKLVELRPARRRILECLTRDLSKTVWLSADGSPPAFAEIDDQEPFEQAFRKNDVDPRKAVAFLLGSPTTQDFVPSALALLIQKRADIETSPTKEPIAQTRRGAPQSEAARQLLLEEYPNGVPEKGIPYKKILTGSNVSKTVLVAAAKKMRETSAKFRSE